MNIFEYFFHYGQRLADEPYWWMHFSMLIFALIGCFVSLHFLFKWLNNIWRVKK